MDRAMMSISDREFESLRVLIYDRFGIHLTDQKKSLMVGRLQKLLRKKNFHNFEEYYNYLIGAGGQGALSELINLISTNYTYFNREKDHFDFFQKTALPTVSTSLKEQKRRDLRVWCAGCSTGEESYTLLMLMMEYFGHDYANWDAGILATDISERVLSIAKSGKYSSEKVGMLPGGLSDKYFVRCPDGEFQANEKLRRETTFRRFNLMNDFPFKKPFQIIFCRNVMIYFDQPTREKLVRRFHQATEKGGFLFIGHSETLGRDHSLYRYVMPAVYQKV